MKRWFAMVLAALALNAAAQMAQDRAGAPDRARLEARLAAVGVLIEKSTAARQIESSGDARATEKHERAREVHRQAVRAFEAGDLERAGKLLPDASALMFEAVRFAAPEQVTAEKQRTDFDARMESVRSLLAAQKRVAAEKPNTPGVREASAAVDKLLNEARELAGAGRLGDARARLDEGYLIAKASISSMRGGDTLVRALKFETREQEFRYEIDRNDTHRMLIQLLLDGRRAGASSDAMVRTSVDKAAQLRQQADTTAAKGDHAGAIKMLEDSTTELVRAIRNAGIFIPG
jgi:hypothetical protein